jgi:nucleotide-binding universal stress UspA family protein
MYKNLLVATDGSDLSNRAVTHAVALAAKMGAKLTLFHARPDRVNDAHLKGSNLDARARDKYAVLDMAETKRILEQAAAQVAAADVPCASVHDIAYSPHEGILAAAAREHCDVIVMASHGRRGVSALVLGSETQKVLSETTLPVLVVR